MVHDVSLIGYENIHRMRGGGGKERLACQKCLLVTLKMIEMKKRRIHALNENKMFASSDWQ